MIKSLNEPQASRTVMLTPSSINEPLALPEGGALVPVLTTIQPAMATIGGADVTLQCVGQNFTPEAFITFNGGEEPTTFVSDTKVTTIVKPSTATTPGSYPVTVVTQFGETAAMPFEFLGVTGGARMGKETRASGLDPDDLEDEIEQAGDDGDFKPTHRGKSKR